MRRPRKQRMDLWADNYSFASRVDVQVYDPLTDTDLGKVRLEVVDDKIIVRFEGVQLLVVEGAVT